MKLDSNSKTIITVCVFVAVVLICILIGTDRAKAGTAAPLNTATPSTYPITCTDKTGKVTLVADGRKVRLAYWTNETPHFTDARPVSRHKRTFKAPAGSTCRN